jgi:methylthioribose-1-phosphate isomerase
LAGRYPAFDLTPASLLTSLIGFDSVYTPESFRGRFLKDSSVTPTAVKENREKHLLVFGVPQQNSYELLTHALKADNTKSILVPEMRPELWGARIIAPELLRRNAPTTLISDNMMGTLFAQRQIARLYLFHSDLTKRGPEGICGSLLAVRLARAHGVPIELQECAAVEEAPLDSDVSSFLGQRIAPHGASIYPLQKEIVPWELFQSKDDS